MFSVQKRLIHFLSPQAERVNARDVRIGLGYTAVKLDSGHVGVAWTPEQPVSCCSYLGLAGTLAGRPAKELLALLDHETSAIARAVGLATANALLDLLPHPQNLQQDVISALQITPDERVAMVGYFCPKIAQLRKIGCRLDIVEFNVQHEDVLPPEKAAEALAGCDVAIITATSLINGTFNELTGALGMPRAAVLLGPSSPVCGDVFRGTKITHVAGVRVRDAAKVLRIVSEGGGTMLMKRHFVFETILTEGAKDEANPDLR